MLFNWNLLGDGPHTVTAFADGVEFARVEVTVTTLGTEFRTGRLSSVVLPDFPDPGETLVLSWNEAQQNFVIAVSSPTRWEAPEAPTNLRVQDTWPTDEVEVSWDAPSWAEGTIWRSYLVRAILDGQVQSSAIAYDQNPLASLSPLEITEVYTIEVIVRARIRIDGRAVTVSSEAASIIYEHVPIILQPPNLRLLPPDPDKVTLVWDAVPYATQYVVSYGRGEEDDEGITRIRWVELMTTVAQTVSFAPYEIWTAGSIASLAGGLVRVAAKRELADGRPPMISKPAHIGSALGLTCFPQLPPVYEFDAPTYPRVTSRVAEEDPGREYAFLDFGLLPPSRPGRDDEIGLLLVKCIVQEDDPRDIEACTDIPESIDLSNAFLWQYDAVYNPDHLANGKKLCTDESEESVFGGLCPEERPGVFVHDSEVQPRLVRTCFVAYWTWTTSDDHSQAEVRTLWPHPEVASRASRPFCITPGLRLNDGRPHDRHASGGVPRPPD